MRGDFAYLTATTLREARDLLAHWGDRARVLAGGTDLVLAMKRGEIAPEAVIDMGPVPELAILEQDGGWLRIGARVSFGRLSSSVVVRRLAPALADAAGEVGSPQVRSMATIGGNIATRSPAGDSLPALVAHGAELVIDGPRGARQVGISDLLGDRRQRLMADELIREVKVPALPDQGRGAFVKLGRRNALAIARISVALVASVPDGGRVCDARLVLGAVGAYPMRVPEAEAVMEGALLTDETCLKIGEAASRFVAGSIPGRPSAPYKTRAVKGIVLEALERINVGR